MKTNKRVLPALLATLFAAAAAPGAQAAQFSNVVVFGDSLSDAGYFRPFLAAIGVPAPLVATLGRFTTNPGPVWSELVASYYGVTPGPSNAAGTIYAQGGARVALTPGVSTPPGMAERPVSTQITEYLGSHSGAADPRALYTMWAGANDVFFNLGAFSAGAISQTALQNNVLGAAQAEIGQIGRLYGAGARYVMVFNIPDIGTTPAFAGTATASSVTQLVVGYNTTLFGGLQTAGLRVIPVDAFSLLAEIRANASAYGFTNTTGIACAAQPPQPSTTSVTSLFCYSGNLVAPNAASTYLFADSVHPTSASHRIVAQFAESLIEGPTAYSLLAEAPLRSRAGHVRTLNDALMSAQQGEMSRWTAFAAVDGGKFDIDAGNGIQGLSSHNRSVSVGLTMRASEAVTLGLGVGKSTTDADFGGGMGSFKTDEWSYSIFGGVKLNGFYANGAGSISDIDFNSVHRNIVLGPVTRVATSSPKGSNASGFANAGYDFAFGRFMVGPTVSYSKQGVTVNAFDEADAGTANLHIAEQRRSSQVWGYGVRASMDLGRWTPWVRVTADRETLDKDRVVTASPLSLATGNSYDIAAFVPDTSFTTAAVGIRGWVGDRIALGVSYFRISGRSQIKDDGVTGTVSVRF